ncbi:MAG TPA: hypothetical protein ENH06_00250 [bacterium]|nr:hypothetical protein [bacterium]
MIKKIKPTVYLKKANGNPFRIINVVIEALRKCNYSEKEIKLFKNSVYGTLLDYLDGNYLNLFIALSKVANLE